MTENCIGYIQLFQGKQGKFYKVDGYKYHSCFPIGWAIDHKKFEKEGSGPKNCEQCRTNGSLRDVFVGYCHPCIIRYKNFFGEYRGKDYGSIYIKHEDESVMWLIYPYMYGVKKDDIGDEETNEDIWDILVSKKGHDINSYDPEVKEQLINGYKICKNKNLKFTSIEEEGAYFSRPDIAAEEEMYYYEFCM
jgi:hypothetical protein